MPFTALQFVAGHDADLWGDALLAAGASSVEATDARAGTPDELAQFAEPGATHSEGWPVAQVSALFDVAIDAERALHVAALTLAKPVPAHRTFVVEDQDWLRATQSQFGPIAIGDRLSIVPTWAEAPCSGAVVRLDPGMAFGTGAHPTTRLCLEWLVERVAGGETVLDYGCGSGVLALAAAKLGAMQVVATDVDPQALNAARSNAQANAVDVCVVAAESLPSPAFDIVVANILANPLVLLAPLIAARVRSGGQVALSGILETQEDRVVIAYSRWFKLAAWRRCEGWTLLAGARRA